MEIKLTEIDELRQEIAELRNIITQFAKINNQKDRDGIRLEFKPDERVPKYVAAKFLGCKQKDLNDFVENGLLFPDKWNRFLVSDLINFKQWKEEN